MSAVSCAIGTPVIPKPTPLELNASAAPGDVSPKACCHATAACGVTWVPS